MFMSNIEREKIMKDKLIEILLTVAEGLQTNKYMNAIKNGFTALLPIIIGGAFFTLILNVVLSTTTTGISLAKVSGMAWLSKLTPMFTAANYATLQFFAIGLVFLIAVELGKHYGHSETILPVVVLSCYIVLCATTATGLSSTKEVVTISNVLARNFTNAQGLFMGMITAIVSTEIYVKLTDSRKLEIRMPETVPSNVAKAFNVLFPAIATIIIVAAFGQIFQQVVGYTFYDAIAKWIQAPLAGILTGLPGYLVIFFISTLLWTVGIHGTQVLKPVYEATMLLALAQNTDAVTAGLVPHNILNTVFVSSFTTITGAGVTGGLIIAIFLFSKRQDYKAIATLSIAPGMFNINETMTFGLPIVLNPILAIPFVIAPAVSATFAFYMTKIGFAAVMAYNVPWTTPPVLMAFLATGGHVGTAIVQGLCVLIAVAIYTPFVLISNRQATEEAALAQEVTA